MCKMINPAKFVVVFVFISIIPFPIFGDIGGDDNAELNKLNYKAFLKLEASEYEESIQILEKAIEIAKNKNNVAYEYVFVGNIGLVFDSMRKYDLALKNYNKCKEIALKEKDDSELSMTLVDINNVENRIKGNINPYKRLWRNLQNGVVIPYYNPMGVSN